MSQRETHRVWSCCPASTKGLKAPSAPATARAVEGTVPGEPGTSAAALLATAVHKNWGVLLKKKREEGHDNNVKHVAAAGEKKRVPGWAEQG